ncbi:MAG: metallophosphoesterase family protein [Candidatus Eremiobacteraeota bacterium]|nr:metallophosphoesterase family protein [Candidatus Eremiobacteraeota bacterium]
MKRVLFSDLHGNDQALERMLERESCTVISAGDVLGRSGSNQKCLELMRERKIASVQGNHELRMLKMYQSGLESWAADWVRSWPLELLDEDALVTHTLFENHDFLDIELPEHVHKLLLRRPLVFTGHQHLPGYWTLQPGAEPFWSSVRVPACLERKPDVRYLVQIGSLGEPMAQSLPRYVSWDEGRIEWHGLDGCR